MEKLASWNIYLWGKTWGLTPQFPCTKWRDKIRHNSSGANKSCYLKPFHADPQLQIAACSLLKEHWDHLNVAISWAPQVWSTVENSLTSWIRITLNRICLGTHSEPPEWFPKAFYFGCLVRVFSPKTFDLKLPNFFVFLFSFFSQQEGEVILVLRNLMDKVLLNSQSF